MSVSLAVSAALKRRCFRLRRSSSPFTRLFIRITGVPSPVAFAFSLVPYWIITETDPTDAKGYLLRDRSIPACAYWL